jgi:hypothetical protein
VTACELSSATQSDWVGIMIGQWDGYFVEIVLSPILLGSPRMRRTFLPWVLAVIWHFSSSLSSIGAEMQLHTTSMLWGHGVLVHSVDGFGWAGFGTGKSNRLKISSLDSERREAGTHSESR